MLWKFDMFKCICINLAFILLSFKCYSVNDCVEKLRQAGYKEKGRICIHSGNEMDYIRYSYALDGCKYAPTYFASRVPIEHTNEYVWNRVITSDEKCLKVSRVCRQTCLLHITANTRLSMAWNEVAFLAYRHAIPRHCFNFKKKFSTRRRRLYSSLL